MSRDMTCLNTSRLTIVGGSLFNVVLPDRLNNLGSYGMQLVGKDRPYRLLNLSVHRKVARVQAAAPCGKQDNPGDQVFIHPQDIGNTKGNPDVPNAAQGSRIPLHYGAATISHHIQIVIDRYDGKIPHR